MMSVCEMKLKWGWGGSRRTDFASWSTSSFPGMPEWPGTHMKLIFQLYGSVQGIGEYYVCIED